MLYKDNQSLIDTYLSDLMASNTMLLLFFALDTCSFIILLNFK